MDTLLQDIRYSVRTLAKSPGFAAVAVLTLALGIGATTAIFSAIEAAMLRPLPFREPERLMQLYVTINRVAEPKADSLVWSYPKLRTMLSLQRSYSSVAAYSADNVSLTGTGDPERLRLEFVSGTYFDLLGIRAQLGRSFLAEEDSTPGTHPVVVLSDALWRRRYGADAAVVGRTVAIDKRPHTVVGVAPASFRGL